MSKANEETSQVGRLVMSDKGFAAATIGTMFLMLKEQYTDAQIKKMFTRKKVDAILKVLGA